MAEQLSIYELIANASLLVQVVMALLVLASVVSWMMIFQRWFFLRNALSEIDSFEDHFWSGIDLRKFFSELDGEENLNGIENIFVSGFKEYTRLSDQGGADADAIMQGVQRAMRVALTREEARLETHLPFLATVGSTSPYRPIRYSLGHYEFVSFSGEYESGNASLSSTRYFGSVGCHCDGPLCRNSSGHWLQ